MGVYCIIDKVVARTGRLPGTGTDLGRLRPGEHARLERSSRPRAATSTTRSPAGKAEPPRSEWADLKSTAGTGEVVGFGRRLLPRSASSVLTRPRARPIPISIPLFTGRDQGLRPRPSRRRSTKIAQTLRAFRTRRTCRELHCDSRSSSANGLRTRPRSTRVPRYLAWDAMFVGLSIAQAVVFLIWPSILTIAIGLWWNANTIAHNFIHRPFFPQRARTARLLGVPQSACSAFRRASGAPASAASRRAPASPIRLTPAIAREARVSCSRSGPRMAVGSPSFSLTDVPAGLGDRPRAVPAARPLRTCARHDEPLRPRLQLAVLQRRLPRRAPSAADRALDGARRRCTPGTRRASRWPAVLRWLDAFGLEGLERLVLRSAAPAAFRARAHERAIRRRPRRRPDRFGRVTIVGGGLFPRTALVLRQSHARRGDHDRRRRRRVISRSRGRFSVTTFTSSTAPIRPARPIAADLVVIPLSFRGDRRASTPGRRRAPSSCTTGSGAGRARPPSSPGGCSSASISFCGEGARASSPCFVLAKVLALAGRDLSMVLVVDSRLLLARRRGGRRVLARRIVLVRPAGACCGRSTRSLALYAALNVPVTRALSSPLTVPMWRAAGGPLLDSITFYLTPPTSWPWRS